MNIDDIKTKIEAARGNQDALVDAIILILDQMKATSGPVLAPSKPLKVGTTPEEAAARAQEFDALLRDALTHSKSVAVRELNMSAMADGFAVLEAQQHHAAFIAMNEVDYEAFPGSEDYFDFETQVHVIETGNKAFFWGAHLFVDPRVPPGTVFVMSRDEEHAAVIRNKT